MSWRQASISKQSELGQSNLSEVIKLKKDLSIFRIQVTHHGCRFLKKINRSKFSMSNLQIIKKLSMITITRFKNLDIFSTSKELTQKKQSYKLNNH